MGENTKSSIQGLNIIPTDSLADELSPISDDIHRDLEAQLAMWTNFQLPTEPTSAHYPSSAIGGLDNKTGGGDVDEDPRIFSPERDTASRSRHKAVDFDSSAFFGNVGASLLAAHSHSHPASGAGGHAAAYERAKLQQLQQHLQHNQGGGAHTQENHHHHAAAAMNDLFSSYLPYGTTDLGPAMVDPFLSASEYATVGVGGGMLPPLTIRNPRQQQQQQRQQQMQTIDPATTSLLHRPIVPLPSTSTKRARTKSNNLAAAAARPNVIIPVDQALDYTLPAPSTIGINDDDDESHDLDMHDDQDDTAPVPPQLDANGQPLPFSAAEDKRRRNTLASARFRQKKKEREAAMERKARDLDGRVAGLERECESLRKENRMLRGLLVDGVPAGVPSVSGVPASSDEKELDGGVQEGTSTPATAGAATGASVVLLEELVRLLRANSAMLQPAAAVAAAPVSAGVAGTGRSSTTGKRKRGGAN